MRGVTNGKPLQYACRMEKIKLKHISPFNLRLQPDLKTKLEREARKEQRSLNAEITARLEESMASRHGLKYCSDGELLDELIRRWGRDSIQLTIRENKKEE